MSKWISPREYHNGRSALSLNKQRQTEDIKKKFAILEGIDVQEGLDRLNGDIALFLKMLAQFAKNQSKLKTYQNPDLLVIDEIGYLPLGQQGSNLFFQVISARHKQKSTIITTNLPFAQWGNIFDSTTVATAIADRLVYNSEILVMEGKSYRKRA